MATIQTYNKTKIDNLLSDKVDQFSVLTGATRATLYAKATDGSNWFGTCTLTSAELPQNHTSTSERWSVQIYRHASNYGSIILISAANGDIFQSSLKNSTTWSGWVRGGFDDNFAYTGLTKKTLAQKGSGVYSYCRFTNEEAPKGSSGTSYSCIVMQNPAKTWTNIWAVAQNDTVVYTAWYNLSNDTFGGWSKMGMGVPEQFRLQYEDGTTESVTFLT